ncbi:hypothetical protein DW940_17310 [Bacteroides uniformis]|nr:hypothetical protein DW940_17310 [Bacteroides uniformis]
MSCGVYLQAHRSGIAQCQGGAPALPTLVKLQQFKPISKLYCFVHSATLLLPLYSIVSIKPA